MRLAQITNGIVTNVLKADSLVWAQTNIGGEFLDIGSQPVSIGDIYENGEFTRPEPVVEYRTEFSPEELLGAFTTEEAFLAASSTVPEVQLQLKVLSFKRPVRIYASDEGYQNAINMLYDNGILSIERRDELLRGLP